MPILDFRRLFRVPEPTSELAPSMLMLRIGLCLVAMWAIFGMIVFETRRHAWSDATTFAADVSTLVEAAIAREFEVYDLSLRALASDSMDPTILALPERMKRLVMFDQSAEASNLGRLFVLDRDGRLLDSSRETSASGRDFSDRGYFRAQRAGDVGLFVDGPFIGRMTHLPSMAISRRRPTLDGSFAGVAVGSLQLSFFNSLLASIHLPPDSSITLSKADGTVLTHLPLDEKDVDVAATGDVLAKAATRDAGIYRRRSAAGRERLFAFRRVGALPLYVTVGLSTVEILGTWRWEMLVIGTGFAISSALILLLGLNLGGELRRRSEAEQRLAELASTDYLTLLANRRRFDEMLEAEWRRGARAGSPLALLMVDGDFFKSFNDTYGHLQGDRVLRSIALALKTCVDRPGDLVARYGGEEFAILLPATTMAGAMIVATAIRAAIDAMNLPHAVTPTGRLTVSIGVACRIPSAAMAPNTLVEAADLALYRAKGEGRDRIVSDDALEEPMRQVA